MKEFNQLLQLQFAVMYKTGKLFRSSITGQQVWDIYLKSFDHDPVFRDPASSEHNCNLCNNFLRRYGNIVAINGNTGQIMTMFDFLIDGEYAPVVMALSSALKNNSIGDVFVETLQELNSLPYQAIKPGQYIFQLGMASNVKRYTKEEAEKYGVVKPDEIRTFNHMHVFLPEAFVIKDGSSAESVMGRYRDAKNVFQRAMEEIPMDTLNLVKDLINQESLLDGKTHLSKVERFISIKAEYDQIPVAIRDNWCWLNSYDLPIAKFRNELIGVLCSELAEGKELNAACQAWNKRVDPANYMKVTAPITQKQIAEAEKFVEDNGYTESFNRCCATIEDIKVTEIKHINSGEGKLKKVSMFDAVKSTATRHKRSEFDGVEEVGIDKFLTDILPGCTGVEAFFTSKHEHNLVTLTTAAEDSRPIFKWNNPYSWTYNGNLAGKSQIKEAVKSQGGKVDGPLRFSIMWAEDEIDNSDLDAHCIEPRGGTEIYFSNKTSYRTKGNLDIDIVDPQGHKRNYKKDVVENITYPTLSMMIEGKYQLFVRQFSARSSKGFKAEVEFEGDTYYYEYNRAVVGDVKVADVTLSNGKFTIEHLLPEIGGASTKEIYGLQTNEFQKVNLVCLSPNHWDGNNVGNKHFFFMLEGCKSPVNLRGFHIENLLPDLAQHRRVLEVLGATHMVPSTNKQLSGLGFNATVKDEVVLRLSGTHKRVIKVRFN